MSTQLGYVCIFFLLLTGFFVFTALLLAALIRMKEEQSVVKVESVVAKVTRKLPDLLTTDNRKALIVRYEEFRVVWYKHELYNDMEEGDNILAFLWYFESGRVSLRRDAPSTRLSKGTDNE